MGQIALGIAKGFDAKEVGRNAAQLALQKMGTGRPSFAVGFISDEFNIAQTVAGITSILGNIPLWGFGTQYPLTLEGEQERSVVIMVVSVKNQEAESHLLSKNEQGFENTETIQRLFSIPNPGALLVAADGAKGISDPVLTGLKQLNTPIIGCLGSGDYLQGYTTQFAGNTSEAEGVALLALGEGFKVGIGLGHGWQDIGFSYQVGRVQDNVIKELDGIPPAVVYERVFGFPAEKWITAPLSQIVSLYPLGIEIFPGSSDLYLRTPISIEADGGLRLNMPVAEGQMAHIMVGDIDSALMAVRQALDTAHKTIGNTRPLVTLVLADYAWHLLFGNRITEVMELIHQDQPALPVLGAYTLGHVYLPDAGANLQVLNQNIMVLIIAEK